jgi:PAS domain S-box-containing protein
VANQSGGTVRTTISVPAGLKTRMGSIREPVNWSAVAAGAFERKLNELIAQRKRSARNRTANHMMGPAIPSTGSDYWGSHRERRNVMKVSDHFENWDNFTDKCSVSLHAVDGNGTILWANDPELKFMGYEPQEYLGRFIGDFHLDKDIIDDILARLTRDETLNAYPARLRAKDGSIKYVMINSNVYRTKGGEFIHTRCFTTGIDEAAWKALKGSREGAKAA